MSLIAHYPFTNDTIDIVRGINTPVTGATNMPAIKTTNGKLGYCMEIPHGIDTLIPYNDWGIFKTSHSYGGWLYFDETKVKAKLNSISFDAATTSATGELLGYNSYGGSSLQWWYNKIRFWMMLIIRANESCETTYIDIEYNKWIHIYCVYNINKNGNKIIEFYKNGILIDSRQITLTPLADPTRYEQSFKINWWNIAGGNGPGQVLPIRMNDIRVYNHALSEKEVKELYKTKVCHYKFNETFQNITPELNIVFNTNANDLVNHWSDTGGIGTYGRDNNSNFVYDGTGLYAHWVSCDISSPWHYLTYNSYEFPGGFRSYQAIIKDTLCRPITENICYPCWNARNGGTPNYLWTEIIPLKNDFYLCKCEGISQDGTNDLVGIFVTPGNKIYISKIYQECSEVCSDIFGSNGVLNDCSGFGNNLIIYNNAPFKNSKDNKIGMYAAKSTGSLTAKSIKPAGIGKDVTVSFWIKDVIQGTDVSKGILNIGPLPPNWQSGEGIYIMIGWGVDIYFTIKSHNNSLENSAVGGIGDIYQNPNWKLLTFVYDGNTRIKKFYINGILSVEKSELSGVDIITNDQSFIELCNPMGTSCSLDDVRIYATALSAEDIKELYDTRGYIDDEGNIYCEEIIEDCNDNLVYNGRFDKELSGKGFLYYTNPIPCTNDGIFNNRSLQFDYYNELCNSELIPINETDIYQFDIWLRSVTETSPYYILIVCYDKNKTYIDPSYVNIYSNTCTTLTADLVDGATTATVNSTLNWNNEQPGVFLHYKQIGICDMPEYQNHERNRISFYYLSISGNVITLQNPYKGPTIKSGTKVAEFSSGGYIYPYYGSALPLTWTNFSCNFGLKTGDIRLRTGTRYVRVGGLLSYSVNKAVRFGGIVLKNLTGTQNQINPYTSSSSLINSKGQLNTSELISSGMPIRYIRNSLYGNTVNTDSHWIEIQAFNEVNTNIILGKLILEDSFFVNTGSAFDHIYGGIKGLFCNGDISNTLYIYKKHLQVSTVTIDIGYITNIERVKIWHYYGDGRKYHKNKLEVSTDGVNWTVVFDSDLEGEYIETAEGRDFYLNSNEVLFNTDGTIYCKQIIES